MAQSHWRRQIKSAFRSVGLDVIRFHPESSDGAKLLAVLRHLETDLVFDVGANEGQYARMLREFGYTERIVSFEPLSSAHARLGVNAKGDAAWIIHPRSAIGDGDGNVTINIAGNNVSSSLLPMLERHAAAAPDSRYIGSETVAMHRLDSVAAPYLVNARSLYLKIDTQGFEGAVVRGAEETLRSCKAVQLEVSLVPLYEGQELWDYFISEFLRRGFVLWTVLPGFVEESTGRTLQMDVIFVRS